MPSSRGFSPPRDWTHVFCSSCITGRFFSAEPSGRPIALSYLGANNNVLQCPWILWWSSGYGSVLSLPMAQVRFQVRELRSHKLWKKRKKVKSLSCVWLFATPWTVVHQAPPSMEFSRQEYWSGLPFPSPISYEVWSKKKKKKVSQVVLAVKNPPANAREIRDMDSIPGSGRSPGKGHGNPLQYACLGNPKDRGA